MLWFKHPEVARMREVLRNAKSFSVAFAQHLSGWASATTLKIKRKFFVQLRGNSPGPKNPAENQEVAGGS